MLNQYIDQTNLKPNATVQDIDQLIKETWQHQFYGICVSSGWIKYVSEQLKWIVAFPAASFENRPTWDFVKNNWEQPIQLPAQTKIKVVCVVGFPLGNEATDDKVNAALKAIENGADEIDMVANIGMFLSHQDDYVKHEINLMKQKIGHRILKVIVETGYLNDQELIQMVKLINQTQTDFIKTNTGFGPRGVSYHDLEIMVQYLNPEKHIKVAGGIKTYAQAKKYFELGAKRIGTSSGVQVIHKE